MVYVCGLGIPDLFLLVIDLDFEGRFDSCLLLFFGNLTSFTIRGTRIEIEIEGGLSRMACQVDLLIHETATRFNH